MQKRDFLQGSDFRQFVSGGAGRVQITGGKSDFDAGIENFGAKPRLLNPFHDATDGRIRFGNPALRESKLRQSRRRHLRPLAGLTICFLRLSKPAS